ncbi:MAG: glycosyltransferase family 2 protein [Kiritimatiellae bacterium]|nr:glycosyltransferase family 2 protein [Kiritimatiellia bacterium]
MNSDKNIIVSVVIPIMNEEDNVIPLAKELDSAFSKQQWEWECLWIDDGSTDQSNELLSSLAKDCPHHKLITFEKNAGQSAAFHAGFHAAKGEIIATIDGDRQNDPADIPLVVEKIISEDWDMVNGYRATRQDNWMRKMVSKVGNGVRNMVTGKTVRDVGCSTRAFKRECVQELPRFKGMHRFLPTFVSMMGYRITEIPVNHRQRPLGTSKYTTWNRMWVGIADVTGVLWLRKRAFNYRTKK